MYRQKLINPNIAYLLIPNFGGCCSVPAAAAIPAAAKQHDNKHDDKKRGDIHNNLPGADVAPCAAALQLESTVDVPLSFQSNRHCCVLNLRCRTFGFSAARDRVKFSITLEDRYMLFPVILKSIVRTGSLRLIDGAGRTHVYGDGSPPHCTVRLRARHLDYTLALNPELSIGEAYMNGLLTVEDGTLYDVLEIAARTSEISRRCRGSLCCRV